MKNRKRIAALALLALLAAAAGFAGFRLSGGRREKLAGNLLTNGDFSRVSDGMPESWETGMWVSSPGASYLEAAEKDGRACVLIENAAENDARFEQTVSVRPGSTLRLSALMMAEGCGDGIGANLSFLGVYGSSEDFSDTGGEWRRAELYAGVPEGMREVTVCLRLGFYGSLNTGRCWFADVALEEAESVPVGAAFVNLATPEPRQDSSVSAGSQKDTAIPLLLAAGAFYLLLCRYLLRRQPRGGVRALLALLLAALLLRLPLAFLVGGYGVDMGCFSAWAARMSEYGPMGFYEEGYFCDYPPAYMLVLGLQGLLARLFGVPFSGTGIQVLLKLSPILCDLAIAAFFWFSLKGRNSGAAFAAAALVAANPALILTGSCWGQIDAVTALLLLLVLSRAREGRWRSAIPLFALAVLTKPQAGLLAPLGLAALAKDVISAGENRRGMLREIGTGLAGGILLTLAVVLPFSPGQPSPFWLVGRYTQTLGSYNYATLSTGNLLFLLGGNWKENGAALLGSVTYGQLGAALMVLSFILGLLVYLAGEGRRMLYPAAALTLQLVFCLGPKMHERYIVPALLLLLMAGFETGDRRFFASFALASAASAVNIGVVLAFEYLIAPNLWLGYLLSVLQLSAGALTAWASASLAFLRRPALALPVRAGAEEAAVPPESGEGYADEPGRLRRILLAEDGGMTKPGRASVLAMLAVTAVYAAVAFYDLGTKKAPQTGYVSTQPGEEILLDLGQERENFHFYYYGGISDTQFTVSVSKDGESRTEPVLAFFDRGECFKWQALRRPSLDEDGVATGASGGMLNLAGRFIHISFEGAGSALWEVAAVDGEGNPFPIAPVSVSGALEGRADDPAKICDEQDAVPIKPSYQNSMYFDEIYHARTGYEHAHALSTYETTHPPLGKDLMALCIRLFGMTPFAWRFAGCLAGILMLPVVWLLALRLLKSGRAALFCCVLLACDCMHFTQTRIATIDSFPVLFMMLMFLFMAKWRGMNLFAGRFSRTLPPLLLSGACMGLAIASKWIGCYGAVGLALLFFGRFAEQFRLWRRAEKASLEDEEARAAAAAFPRRAALTVAWCVFSFVLVPLAIYCASYIPYLSHFGPVVWNARTFRRIWDAQVLMFDYHKNLVATHYFSSPWYEWPLIVKPMWYYNADYAAPGMASSILSFGNPAVWWTGLAAILAALAAWLRSLPRRFAAPGETASDSEALSVIAAGFLSAYLPWVLVSRLTFIYHYFASVPFVILATGWALQKIAARRPRAAHIGGTALCLLALLLFIGFYPLASGHEVPRAWCDFMNWFKGSAWMWY